MFDTITPGPHPPDTLHVIIEIPAYQNPIKYEVNKETGAIFVDRFMSTCMHYPGNYGYIPQTLAEDGDPMDVLVITPFPVIPASVILSRPLAMLEMEDECGMDYKILAVPVQKLSPIYDPIHTHHDLPPLLIQQIEHFFGHYKDLEKNKWVKVGGWQDLAGAKAEILKSIQRFSTS